MVATYTIGSDANQSLESAAAEPMDQRGNISHGNTITVNESFMGTTKYHGESGTTSQTDFQKAMAGAGNEVRSASGQPRAFASKPDDVMTYGGLQTQASVLEGMGVVALNPATGRYEFTEASTQVNQTDQAAPASSDPHETFAMSEAENGIINDLLPQGVNASQLSAATSQSIQGAISGDMSAAARTLAQHSGQSPAEATETISKIAEQYTKASTKYLTEVVKLPADHIESFYDYIRTEHPADTKAAISAMINTNNFKAMGKLVSKYARAFPPSAEQLNQAGIKTVKTGTNKVETIKVGGISMSIQSARRAGLI